MPDSTRIGGSRSLAGFMGRIRTRLMLLVVVALVPMVALIARQLLSERRHARDAATVRTSEVARLVASRADEFVRRIESVLGAAALQVRASPPDIAYNDRLLRALDDKLIGTVGTLNVHDLEERNIGSSFDLVDRSRPFTLKGRRYYEDAMRTGGFAVGEPVKGRADSTRWFVSFALPLRAEDGAPRGLVYATLRLDSLGSVVDPGTLPPRSNVNVVDSDGRLVYRLLNTSQHLGRDISRDSGTAEILASPTGTRTQFSSIDGQERLIAWQRLQNAPWTVVIGVPIDQILAVSASEARFDLVLAIAVIVSALLIAYVVAGRLSNPVLALTADAEAIRGGDLSRRTSITSRGELGLLAVQFNAMASTLEGQTRTLVQSEERYRELFDLSPLPTWLFDEATLRFLAVNEAALKRYEWTRAEFMSLSAADVRPDEDVPEFRERVAAVDDTLHVTRSRSRHRTKSGVILEVEVTSASTIAFGRRAWLVVVNDLTERELTEAALRDSQAQIRQMQKIEAVGGLAAGIAHDFNNLLTGILGSVDLAAGVLDHDHPARIELAHARATGQRASELTKRLLTFSRQQSTDVSNVDLRDVARGMQPLLERTLGAFISLELQLAPESCVVLADPAQVEQIILNLALNARDAMPDGGTVELAVRVADADASDAAFGGPKSGRWVLLSVRDAGAGMDSKTVERVFEPFFTTKERGRGTGLGLSVVYGIVRSAEGTIAIQSALGEGTTVRVYLPLSHEPQQRVHTPATGLPAPRGVESILLVEDEDAVRRVATRLLRALGYSVTACPTPHEALELVQQREIAIDLLFTDMMMPGMNGRELANLVLALRPGLPVVFTSGYTDDEALISMVRADNLFFLQKPFKLDALGGIVRAALDQRAGAQDARNSE